MKQDLIKLLEKILAQMGAPDIQPSVTLPDDPRFGEYTTNAAMVAAKILRRSPIEIAKEIISKLKAQGLGLKAQAPGLTTKDVNQNVSSSARESNVLQDIDKIEAVPPGFINFYLSEAGLVTRLKQVTIEKESYGRGRNQSSGLGVLDPELKTKQRVMVEYTDPNPFKEFHIGHLYSNAVGESLARLYEAMGWEVKRADYYGDVGMHVAKAVWGMISKLKVQSEKLKVENLIKVMTELENKSLAERVKWMGRAYAQGASVFESGGAQADEIKRLNKLIFIASQKLAAEEKGTKPVVDYRRGETIDEKELAVAVKVFEAGRQWSMEYFEQMFARLGTGFDYYYPESEVGEYGVKLVMENLGEVFEESQGAVVFRGEKAGLHTRVFINTLGLPTYEAKELGLNWKKHQDYPADLSLIITGNEINEYFKVVLKAMSCILPHIAAKTRHLGHGMVRLPRGKMSSRTGNVLTGDWLLEEAKNKIYDILQKTASKYSKAQSEDIAEKAAVAAVKYAMLRVAVGSDIAFDLDKSVAFDGDSGPYLQYTYARAMSVLRKAQIGQTSQISPIGLNNPMNPEERLVTRYVAQFPEIVEEAAANLSPNALCGYLFKLAQAYNNFYNKHTIINRETRNVKRDTKNKNVSLFASHVSPVSQFRLLLTQATAQVLKNGLYLLGIRTLERM